MAEAPTPDSSASTTGPASTAADLRIAGGPSPRAVLAVVGFGVFIAADDLTVVSTMLRPIIGDLGLVLPDGLDDAAWIVNAYLIAYIAVMPIAGRLSDVIGRRRTFLGAYALFLAGSILIPLTSSLGPFLVGRVLTALGGGAMVPVALAVIGDVYSERGRARALGTLGAIDTFGWVWGPMYGAVLVRFLSWQWQFWLNIPLAIVGMVAVWWALADHDRPARGSRVDWVGAGLLTAALVSLNLALLGSAEIQSVSGLDELTGSGGTELRWLYPVAIVAAIAFVWHERRSDHPLVERTVFRGRNVRAALVVNFVVGAALVIAMVDVPIFINAVEVDVERSAVAAGWVLSALTAAMAVASYVGGRIAESTWYRPPVLLGMALDHLGLPHDGAHLGGRHLLRGVGDPARRARCGIRARAGADDAGRRRPRPRRRARFGRGGGDGGPPARTQRRALGADRLRARPVQRAPPGHRAAAARRSRFRGRVACRAGDAHRRRHRRDVPDVRRRHRHRRRGRTDDAAPAVISPPRRPRRRIPSSTRQENSCSPGCNAT